MKKFINGLNRAMMLIASLLLLAANTYAGPNDFTLRILNLTQPTDRTIEFDVYLLDSDATQPFELGSIQLGIILNSGIYTGGTLTAAISNTGSGLNALQQFTATPSVVATLTGFPGKTLIRLAGRPTPGAGGGTILSNAGNGTLVTHYVLTSSVAWVANQTPDLEFTSSSAINPLYATRLSQYISTINTPMTVTPGVNALICCNPALNAAAPQNFSVTGTGSYCQGGTGLPVGLSGSEAGATYQLIKDGIPSGAPVPGTGASLSFGNQNTGTYTVTGTIGSTTTPMTGSAVISETPPPVQPGDFTVSSPVIYKGTQGVIYTVPAVSGATSYTWTYSGSGATFSSVTNSVSISFSQAATSGTLSVTANNSCGSSAARTLAVSVNSIQASDYLLQVMNLTQSTDNTIEFDVYLKDTEPTIPLQLASVQLGFLLNSGIYTGGALTATISNTGSGLSASQQFSATPSVVTVVSGYPNQTLLRLSGNTPPGAGGGTIISTSGNGTLLTHFTLTSTVPWTAFSLSNLTFTSSTALSPLYATRLSEYIGTTNTSLEVIPGTNALVCCNPALNAGPPTAFAVIGGGAYCEGGTGLPVDLASSQTGVSYQLYKDAVATGTAVPGTGAAISFGNQPTGTYTVTGTNISGTTPMTGSAVITMNPLPLQPGNFTASTSTLCQGASGIVYTVPADPSVTFNWNYSGTGVSINGSGNSVTLTFSATATSGNLSVTATNTCGTSVARSMAVTVNPTPIPSLSGLSNVCEGTMGVVYTTEAGMTGYQWIVSAGGTITSGGTNTDNTVTVTWASAGNQSVSVNYSNGNCTAVIPTLHPVTVNTVPAAPSASVTQQPTCILPTGTITVTSAASGYSINGTDYSNTNGVFTNLAPDIYNVTVINSAGCVSPVTQLTVNTVPGAPPAPSAAVTAQPTCEVSAGTIRVSLPVPAVGLFYSIDGTTYTNTSGIFAGVSSGIYNVTYKDGGGCISSPVTVTVDPAPAISSAPLINATQPGCNETTGIINVTSPASADGITFSIDGILFTNVTGTFTGVIPGNYNVTYKNAAGCVSPAASVTINNAPETPAIPQVEVTQPTCSLATGTIVVTPLTGTGISYSIDGLNYSNTSGTFPGAAAGTYNITVKNSVNCISLPTQVTVDPQPETPAAPDASVSQQPTCDVQTGTITVISPAPGSGISYSVDGISYANTTGTFTNLTPGSYNVSVKNASGCISAALPLTVNAIPGSPAQPSNFTVFTSGVYKGTSNVIYTVPADPQATSYSWSYSGTGATINGNTNSVTVSFSATATSGALSVMASNGCGLSAARTLDITVNSLLSSDYLLQVLNMVQTSPTTLEFDVYLLDVEPAVTFELASIQLGFLLNSGIYAGGTLAATISNTGSGLNSIQQFTAAPTIGEGLAGYPGQTLIRLAGKTPPGAGNGTTISTSGNGTLLTHFVITSSTAFAANTRPELVFTSGTAALPLYATRLSEYIGGVNTALSVIPGTNANVCCNPLLSAAAPLAFNVTGSGSYCEGGTGLSVGLSDSETGVSYQLFKDGLASGLPVNGTGAALDFGTQTAGTYTVTATNLTGSTPMSGSAVITVTPLPAQPGNFIASSAIVYQGATGVVYTVPSDPSVTYSWSYSGNGATINGTTNSITLSFSSTATSGSLSVIANNTCGASVARSIAITVNALSSTDYLLQILNLTQPADNTIEFDVYLLDSEPSQALQLASVQIGFLIKSDIYTGGTLTAAISNAGSGLLASQQFTATPSVVSALAGYPSQTLIRLAGNTPPGAGSGTIISTTGNGTLLTHFTLTSTVPWTPNLKAGLVFTSSAAANPLYSTRLSEYVGTTNTALDVIPGTNALVCCDPLLNAGPPSAYSVIGGGSYCEGGTGLSVDLAGSQTGVEYKLFRNGIEVGTPVPGTGSSISFGNQVAGIYTVEGTNVSGTTPMTGSVVIIMTPLPVQPGDFTASTSAVCQNTSGNVFTVPDDPTVTFNWSFSGTGATIYGTGNSVTVTFSETATSGTLSVIAANTCGTSNPRSIAITMNPRPVPVISGLNLVCEGTAGVVYTTEAGMSAYEWIVSPGGTITSGGTPTDNTVTVTWTTAGNQTVSVNYSNGNCTALNPVLYPVTVNSLPAPAAVEVINPDCNTNTGTINVTSPLSEAGYSINGVDYTNTSGVFTGVVAGTYSVTVKNAAGCVSAPTSVTVNAAPETPAAPTASVTQQPTCEVATGTITVSSPVPALGISFSINGVDYTNTSGVFTGVVAGTYSVTVKNAAGCVSAPTSVTVNAAPETPAAPTASVTQQPTCEVATGTITVSSPVPATGISYSIDGADYTNTSGVFSGVTPGTYQVTVKNAAGCVSAPTSVTVNAAPETPAAPTASVTQQPTCEVATGTITVSSPVPAQGISFSINGTDYTNTSGVFTGVVAGTYSVTCKNAAGCVSAPTSVTVEAAPETPAAPVASVTSQPTCEVATGTITVSSPVPATGISYSIDGADYTNTSGVFSGVVTGTYSVTVKNAAGCVSAPTSVTVEAAPETPAAPVASVTQQPTCEVATGTITVSSPVPATGISYSIDGADYTNTSGVFSGVTPGTYQVTVKNAAGCVSAPTSVTVEAAPETPAAPVASVTSQPTCEVATGTITVSSPVPATGISYSIDGADYTNTSGVFTGVVAGTYSVTCKNAAGCISAPTSVTVNAAPETPAAATASVTQQPTCEVATGTITVSSPAPAQGISFSINGTDYTNTSGAFTGVVAGTYSVTCKNAAGCISAPTSVTVNAAPETPAAPTASVTQQPTCEVATGNITVSSPVPAAGITYSINGVDYTNTSGVFTGVVFGTYSVTVKNAAGCVSAPTSVTVNAAPETPAAPTASVTQQPTCEVATGTITVSSPVPALGISFSINGVDYTNTSGVFTGVVAGTYSVTVKNAAGCVSAPTSVTVNAAPETPAAPTASVTQQPTCEVATGTITVSSPVPAIGISFSINGTDYTNTSGAFTGVVAGTYQVTVKDAAGCVSAPTSVTVNAAPDTPAAPMASVTSQPTCEVATGTITVTSPVPAEGWIFQYSYNQQELVTNTTGVFTGLAPGVYYLSVVNPEGCTSYSTTVTVNSVPEAPDVPLVNITQPTCDIATGTITITSPVPAEGISYSIDGVDYTNTSGVFTSVMPGIYNVTVRNAAGCLSAPRSVTLIDIPEILSAPVVIVDFEPECDLEYGEFHVTSPDYLSNPLLRFSIDGVNYENQTGGFTYLAPGTYYVTYRITANGCTSPATEVIIREGPKTPAAPVATVTQSTCDVPLGTITVTSPDPSEGYFYSIDSNDYTNTSGIFSNVPPGTYSITVSNAAGCMSAWTLVNVNTVPDTPAAPVASVTSQPTCEVATGTITVSSPAPAEGISYSINGVDYTNTSGVFTGVVAGTYSVVVKNAAGCVSAPTPVTVRVAEDVTPSQPGAFTESSDYMCAGTSETYTVPYVAGVTYSWNFTGEGAAITGSGNSVNVSMSQLATSGTLSVVASNSCGTSSAREIYITVRQLPGPAGIITGETSVCPGAKGVVYTVAAIPNAVHYRWTVPTGATIVSGDDTNSIIVNFSENAASGVITVQGWKICGDGATSPELMITVSSNSTAHPGEFTESTGYMCAGTSANFTVPIANVTYSWSFNGQGATITGSGNSVTITMAKDATSGTLSVVATNGCGTSSAREIFITVRQLPGPAGVITGETNVCPGASGVVYTVAAIPNAVHYRWTVPTGATIVSGDDTNTITVNFSENASSGMITVQGWKSCGEGAKSPELNITVKQLSAGQPGEFTESSSYICAGSSATFTVPYVANVTYSWSFSGKGATITGTGNSVIVSFAPDATTGTLSVVAANNCGTSTPRTINLTVRQLPAPAGIIKGPEEVCQGSKAVVYSVPVIQNAVEYIWTVPSGATVVSGQNSNTITVNFSNDAVSGVITVQGSKSCGTGKQSPEFRVTVRQIPDAPVISFSDGVLRSDALIGNQWYFSGNPISNAVNDTYVPQENGSYFTVVTLDGCSSPKSNLVDVVLPEKGLRNTDIDIYPVPTKGDFTVTITSDEEKTIDILVFNSSGTKVHEVHNVVVKDRTELPFELSSLPAGIYYLRFIGPDGQAIKTVILTR